MRGAPGHNEATIEMRFYSDTRVLSFLRGFVDKLDRHWRLKLGAKGRLACKLALTEAFTNSIVHAHKGDKSKIVTVRMKKISGNRTTNHELRTTCFRMEVEDSGTGVPLLDAHEPMPHEDHGRGVLLIKMLLDNVRCERTAGGSCLVMEKGLAK